MLKFLRNFWNVIWLALRVPFSLEARCEFSKRFFDVHDYPVRKGGDGTPSHFFRYRCHKCGARFTI